MTLRCSDWFYQMISHFRGILACARWYRPLEMKNDLRGSIYELVWRYQAKGFCPITTSCIDVCGLSWGLLTWGLWRSSSCCFNLSLSFSICRSLIWLLPPMTPVWGLVGSGPPCFTGALWVIRWGFRAAGKETEKRTGLKWCHSFSLSVPQEKRPNISIE